jgi:hypothetical protein
VFALVCAAAASGCQLLAGAGVDPNSLGIPGAGATGSTGNGSGGVAGVTSEPVEPSFTLPPDAGSGGAPTAIAAYRTGRAIVVLGDGTRLELDRINRGPHVYQQFGSQVRWSNAFGWYVTVSGAGAEADMGAPYVILDHIVGGQHLTTDSPTACAVTIEVATPQQLRGSATCRSVHWTDAIDIGIDGAHRDAGLPAFSADITFEAGS